MTSTTLARPATGLAQVPSFFDPKNAGNFDYRPNHDAIFREATDLRARKGVKPSATDKKVVHALLIDVQKDFCHTEGSLYVGGRSGTGAIDDSARMADWLYQNLPIISKITCTLDTHIAYQIFSRSFWQKEDGSAVDAHTEISAEDVRKGVYRPTVAAAYNAAGGNYEWLLKQVIHYCEELERAGKYKLYIWPEHCLLGSSGHTLVGVIEEAAVFHAYARGQQNNFEIKGANALTENYSVLRPEVLTRHDGQGALGQKNTRFVETLFKADYVVIGGQAASHCVASSIDDLLGEILVKDPSLARKVYVVEDFMSAVTVPDGQGGFFVDYTPQAEAALKRFADAGMHVVKSSTPIDQWPDFVL